MSEPDELRVRACAALGLAVSMSPSTSWLLSGQPPTVRSVVNGAIFVAVWLLLPRLMGPGPDAFLAPDPDR